MREAVRSKTMIQAAAKTSKTEKPSSGEEGGKECEFKHER